MIELCRTASSFFADAIRAARTWPDTHEWRQTFLIFAILLLAATLVSKVEYTFNFSAPGGRTGLLAIAAVAIVVPALGEEMVFRVLLAGRRGWWRGTVALAAFVLWHPAQVWLGLPMAQDVFLNPGFLVIVAALGLGCTVAYRTSGSIWPPVAIHWAMVVVWKGTIAPV
ncbi:CPBP family glutamic-type intramembrane protease [Maricaulis sp.]|uniref:CPBP family glutamic-type intramembrane protease n=1 Tax=Maricaulis sp. TaxID=1486257 RepID=UPI00260CB1C0|nr:CPBP family glutamic-type intramembrane protease [Maricaulis sp.]